MSNETKRNLAAFAIAGVTLAGLIGMQGLSPEAASYTPQGEVENTSFNNSQTDEKAIHNPNGVDWERISRELADSVVSIRISNSTSVGLGSGVILNKDGLIVTNAHVVDSMAKNRNSKLTVILNDNSVYEAKIIKTDAKTDLAIIKITNPPTGLKPIKIGESSKSRVGDPVLAIGNPLGLSGTVTNGIVSSINRPMSSKGEGDKGDDSPIFNAIQTNAAINQGNSGGALVNAQGQLIGINSSIATTGSSSGNIGIGFAVPSDTMKRVIGYLAKGESFPYGKMGVSVSQGIGKYKNKQVMGAIVRDVVPGSGAQAAGLRAGDTIVKVNNMNINSDSSLVAEIRTFEAGSVLDIQIFRNGDLKDMKVKLSA